MTLRALLHGCWGYLVLGPDALYLDAQWLRERMPQHDTWTRQQLEQGRVVKDVAATRRDRFWANVVDKRIQVLSKVKQFPQKVG